MCFAQGNECFMHDLLGLERLTLVYMRDGDNMHGECMNNMLMSIEQKSKISLME